MTSSQQPTALLAAPALPPPNITIIAPITEDEVVKAFKRSGLFDKLRKKILDEFLKSEDRAQFDTDARAFLDQEVSRRNIEISDRSMDERNRTQRTLTDLLERGFLEKARETLSKKFITTADCMDEIELGIADSLIVLQKERENRPPPPSTQPILPPALVTTAAPASSSGPSEHTVVKTLESIKKEKEVAKASILDLIGSKPVLRAPASGTAAARPVSTLAARRLNSGATSSPATPPMIQESSELAKSQPNNTIVGSRPEYLAKKTHLTDTKEREASSEAPSPRRDLDDRGSSPNKFTQDDAVMEEARNNNASKSNDVKNQREGEHPSFSTRAKGAGEETASQEVTDSKEDKLDREEASGRSKRARKRGSDDSETGSMRSPIEEVDADVAQRPKRQAGSRSSRVPTPTQISQDASGKIVPEIIPQIKGNGSMGPLGLQPGAQIGLFLVDTGVAPEEAPPCVRAVVRDFKESDVVYQVALGLENKESAEVLDVKPEDIIGVPTSIKSLAVDDKVYALVPGSEDAGLAPGIVTATAKTSVKVRFISITTNDGDISQETHRVVEAFKVQDWRNVSDSPPHERQRSQSPSKSMSPRRLRRRSSILGSSTTSLPEVPANDIQPREDKTAVDTKADRRRSRQKLEEEGTQKDTVPDNGVPKRAKRKYVRKESSSSLTSIATSTTSTIKRRPGRPRKDASDVKKSTTEDSSDVSELTDLEEIGVSSSSEDDN